jgi:septum formation protein
MIILGSQSPRRKLILSYFSLPFKQVSSNFDEDSVAWEGDPIGYVNKIALGKARALAHVYPKEPVLTADTIVYQNGEVFLKPKDAADAYGIFQKLTGSWHSVFTGVALAANGREYFGYEGTKILFNKLTDEQIHAFLNKLPYSDKAGGYFSHGSGSLLINRMEGCFYNAVGLPTNTVHQLLLNVGIDLWNYLLPPMGE